MASPPNERHAFQGSNDAFEYLDPGAIGEDGYHQHAQNTESSLLASSSSWNLESYDQLSSAPLLLNVTVSSSQSHPAADTSTFGQYMTMPMHSTQPPTAGQSASLTLSAGNACVEENVQWPQTQLAYCWDVAPVPMLDDPIQPEMMPPNAALNPESTEPPEPEASRKKKRGRPRLVIGSGTATTSKNDEETQTHLGSATSDPGAPASPNIPQREWLRARNRAAATRYRNKIQAMGEQLVAKEHEALTRRDSLLACVDQLRGELQEVQNELLQHSGCDDPLIQGYLSTAAPSASLSLTAPQIGELVGNDSSVNVNIDPAFMIDETEEGGVDKTC